VFLSITGRGNQDEQDSLRIAAIVDCGRRVRDGSLALTAPENNEGGGAGSNKKDQRTGTAPPLILLFPGFRHLCPGRADRQPALLQHGFLPINGTIALEQG
jgi:hypothetical protein